MVLHFIRKSALGLFLLAAVLIVQSCDFLKDGTLDDIQNFIESGMIEGIDSGDSGNQAGNGNSGSGNSSSGNSQTGKETYTSFTWHVPTWLARYESVEFRLYLDQDRVAVETKDKNVLRVQLSGRKYPSGSTIKEKIAFPNYNSNKDLEYYWLVELVYDEEIGSSPVTSSKPNSYTIPKVPALRSLNTNGSTGDYVVLNWAAPQGIKQGEDIMYSVYFGRDKSAVENKHPSLRERYVSRTGNERGGIDFALSDKFNHASGDTYYWMVEAAYRGGYASSAVVSFEPSVKPKVSAPRYLNINGSTSNYVSLNWVAPQDIKQSENIWYYVYFGRNKSAVENKNPILRDRVVRRTGNEAGGLDFVLSSEYGRGTYYWMVEAAYRGGRASSVVAFIDVNTFIY